MRMNTMHKGAANLLPLGPADFHLFRSLRTLCRVLAPVAPLVLALGFRVEPAQSADQKTVSIPIPISLDTALDSKKRAVGDPVEAKIASPVELSNGTVLPRDAKVTGHITEAKARSKGDSESSLGLVFEKIAMPNGKTLSIKGYLQAVAPNPNADQSGGGVDYGSSINRSLQHAGPGMDSHTATPVLNAQSTGVQGIKDLALNEDGLLTSPGKAVKLDHGVQVMLRAQLGAEQ